MASALREVLARFGVKFDSKELEHGHDSIEGTIHKLEQLGGLIAGSVIVHGIHHFIEDIVETASSLEHMSVRTGVATDELQGLTYAAKSADISQESLDSGLTKLGKNLGGIGPEAKAMSAAFAHAGIKMEGADGKIRTAAEVLPEIAEAFTRIENPSERAALAMKFFGKGGAELIPLLAQGAEGIHRLTEEAHELGGGLNEETIEAAGEMEQATKRLDFAFLGLKGRIAVAMLPFFTKLTEGLVRVVVWIQKTTANTNIFKSLLTILGAGGLASILKLLGGFKGIWSILGKLLFRLALPALLIDELITTWQGGDTIIRRIIDGWFGEGRTTQIVDMLKQAWEGVKRAILGGIQVLKDHAGQVAAVIAVYGLFRAAVIALTAAKAAYQAVLFVVSAAQAAYTAIVTAGTAAYGLLTGATVEATMATIAAEASMATVLATTAAVTAAVLALVAAWSQLSKLSNETEGLGITGVVTQMVKQGTLNPFEAVNNFQNQRARERAGAVGAAATAAAPTINVNVDTTINGNADKGVAREIGKQVHGAVKSAHQNRVAHDSIVHRAAPAAG